MCFLSVDNIHFYLSAVDKSTLVPVAYSGTFRSYVAVFRAATGLVQLRCIPSYNTGIYHYLYFIFILIHARAVRWNKFYLCNVQKLFS